MSDNSISYDYDEEAAGLADNVSSRIDTNGPYIGRIKSANAMKAKTGTHGIHFEFEAPGGGSTSFDLYTKKDTGEAVFGVNQLMAMQTILGLKGLKSKTGKYEGWVDGTRQEVEGEIFPDLCDKDIGLVFQKRLFTKTDGSDGFGMELQGVFHPTTKLTASEIKERKTTPVKLEQIVKGLRTKDTRKARAAEPAQPAVGAESGSY